MSRRFLRWAETWADTHVRPGEGADIESNEARTRRLVARCGTDALAAGFTPREIEEESALLTPLIFKTLTMQTLHNGDDLDDDQDD